MRNTLIAVLAALLSVALLGCSSEKDRGKNKDRERPRATDRSK